MASADAIEQPLGFGERLRLHREAAGLSQQELAGRAGLTANAIAALERGRRRRPYPDTVRRLAAALDLSGDEQRELVASIPPRGGTAPPTTAPPVDQQPGLPGPLDALIGREREIAAVTGLLLTPNLRLLTLTGPGGVGKTRLALAAAQAVADAFPGDATAGVTFVSLAPLADARLVLPAIGQALGMPESGAPPPDALPAWLKDRRALVLLDNFEHVMAAAPEVAALLRACPRLSMLVTSREALRVRDEQQFAVPPLTVPSPTATGAPLMSAAVRLFVARARSADHGFELTPADGDVVAEICRRLDGLPLAIELAAARIPLLPPRALLSRLAEGPALPLLTGGARDLPQRQQTLRRTLEWSYDLLDPAEQAAFRRLAILAGATTLEAATAVVAGPVAPAPELAPGRTGSGQPLSVDPAAMVDIVTSLVAKNLLRQEEATDAEPRLRMLAMVRELGRDLLAASGELDATRRRAITYYLALAERAEPELTGPRQGAWLDRLEAEHDNLRAALSWTVDTGLVEEGLRLASALALFWHVRGHPRQGSDWLRQMTARARGVRPLAVRQARALSGLSRLSLHLGDVAAATAAGEEALALARSAGDRREIAHALNRLAGIASQTGAHDRVADLHREALTHLQAIGDEVAYAGALADLGQDAFNRGALNEASALLTEAVERLQAIGQERGVAVALGNLGRIALRQGDLDRAAVLHEQAIALHRRLGYKRGQAIELDRLAIVARYRDDLPRAAALQAESLVIWRELDDPVDLALWLQDVAALEAASGRHQSAIHLLGAATAGRAGAPNAADPAAWSAVGTDETVTAVRRAVAALGETGFCTALAAGRNLSLEDALTRIDPVLADYGGEL